MALQNPVSRLIVVQFQNNTDFNIGPYDRTRDGLTMQPVLPARLSDHWNVTTRLMVPVAYQPEVTTNRVSVAGLGDIQSTFLLAPAVPGKLIWGIGPTFLLPTATDAFLRTGRFSAGPAVLLVVQPGKWTIGTLTDVLFSMIGSSTRRELNLLEMQYFVNYNLPKGWYLVSAPKVYADWKASSGNVWTIPFGGGVGRVLKVGPQTINAQIAFYGNVVRPSQGANRQLRLQLGFLYPRKPK